MLTITKLNRTLSVVLALAALPALAETPQQLLTELKQAATSSSPGFQDFSAARGEKFFKSTHGNDWSCSTCHSANPATPGKHVKTSKVIQPLAPAVNQARFTDPAKVEKWFKRNCNDVVNRTCTPLEKGDVLTFLMTLK